MDKTIHFSKMASVKEAAKIFGVTPGYLRTLCRNGKVRFVEVSRTKWLVNLSSLDEFFSAGSPIPAAQADTMGGIRRVKE